MNWKNILIGLGSALFFSILFITGVFNRMGDQVYDIFLYFRPEREFINDVVFLDVDDYSIAYNGVFPWPRSITADGLLRLKEYGARAAIFDIEYINKGPQGVDTVYLNSGLPADFDSGFFEIANDARDLIYAIRSGSISSADIDEYSLQFLDSIDEIKFDLYARAQGIARDNDLYMIQASALFGRSWVTLNLRSEPPIGEEAERRLSAEEHFSYPITALPNASKGKFSDILPALPGFAQVAEGAGFTNVEIDKDGIRRRIYLAQNIHDHWYLQLAFAPLINFLGNPEIELSNRKMLIKGAKMPGGITRDISIPLDGQGRMLLDWPKKNYYESYKHVSFADISVMEDIEVELAEDSRDLRRIDFYDLAEYDSALGRMPNILINLTNIFAGIYPVKTAALEGSIDEYFEDYVNYRSLSRSLIREILELDPYTRVNALIPELIEAESGNAEYIRDLASYIMQRTDRLRFNLEKYEEISAKLEDAVKDKFCILGRTDTGTTDIGANPFFGEYVNVGTHGVVLDMILSESFIFATRTLWQVLISVVLVLLFFFVSIKFPPVPRAASGFLTVILVIAASAFLFRFTGMFFNPLLTVLSMVSAVILREIVSYAGSEREKQFIRKAFSTYVSDDVVKEIISDPSRLQLGGTKYQMSAIFTDIQGFSTIAEQLDPESLVSLLNRYLTVMSDTVLEEKGTIDKYEGDAIIAFFGAPIPSQDHAIRACNSAIAMKRIEAELNIKILEEKISPTPLLTRIGINTGSMVAGNMGTAKKMDYTIMGNAVNLAARLEGVNKQYKTWIIASDDTIKETGGLFLTRKLDRVRVVGISEPVRLHELIETMDSATPEKKKMVEVFHQALELYENRNWKEAAKGFKESYSIEKSGPSFLYFERCKAFLLNPPKDSWDGITNITEK